MSALFDEIKDYVGFGPEDVARLQNMRERVRPCFQPAVDDFYARIQKHPGAQRAITGGSVQVERLKGTLMTWLEGVFTGPYDAAYFEQRARIGRVHVRIDLPQQYMLTAMNGMRIRLAEQLRNTGLADPATLSRDLASLHRILDMELAIMLHTYREDYLRKMQQAERLSTFGALVGGIGHELRNPLSVMESSLYLLRARLPPDDERASRHADKIGAQIRLSNSIITELLDLIRDKPPEPRPVAPHVLVRESLEGFATPPGTELRLEVDAALPKVQVDPGQVRQVFTNLVQNAVEAMAGTGAVVVDAYAETGCLVFRVADSGPGVTPDVRARMFEPLVTTKSRGAGLGLALCHKLVEINGGSIALAAAGPLSGACLEVRLPLAATEG